MLIFTIHADVPLGDAIGVKEVIAMEMEKHGDVRVVSVREVEPEQLKMKGV